MAVFAFYVTPNWWAPKSVTVSRSSPFFYGEFDGRRPKRVMVKIIGE